MSNTYMPYICMRGGNCMGCEGWRMRCEGGEWGMRGGNWGVKGGD